jgi:Ca2+-binding EF-hand superfamily protein
LEEFLNGFDGMRGNNDGTISRQEWNDYYTDLSMSLPSDEYFVRMMESVWQICEDETATVSAEQIKHLTKTIRSKLMDFSAGQTEELVLRNTFREFDANENGVLSSDELQALLVRLQISVERRYLSALLRKFDRNNNGVIEFEEFVNFIINDPYK